MEIKVTSNSEQTTMEIAKKYAMSIKSPCVISLEGDLGAGKTTFAKGFALGLSAHGMGTSRAFQISEKAGAFSGLAMGLTGIVTALIAPYVAAWILPLFYP